MVVKRNAHVFLITTAAEGKSLFENLGVDERMILKWFWDKYFESVWN
jgi:hypothetical protein